MSSTRPVTSSIVTESPMRIGWVMAIISPAIGLAKTWRAASPMTSVRTALEARIPAARRSKFANFESASEPPITRIPTKTSRRTTRSRVCAARETPTSPTCPPRGCRGR